jgi:hypothetical protein
MRRKTAARESRESDEPPTMFQPLEIRDAPLGWLHLGGLFCIEFGAGTLAALAWIPPAPVGPPFYRLLTALATIPLVLGAWLLYLTNALPPLTVAALAVALAAAAVFAVKTKGLVRWSALAVAIGAAGAAVCVNTVSALEAGSALRLLAVASAVGSGLVVGLVGVAMTLGHAYLTYPNLKIVHLSRVNRACALVILTKGFLVAATLYFFEPTFEPLQRTVASMGGVFGLFTRFSVGIAMPLAFAWMVSSSIKYNNTRSATGILYASTVLVLIGEAMAISLRGQAGGVPL